MIFFFFTYLYLYSFIVKYNSHAHGWWSLGKTLAQLTNQQLFKTDLQLWFADYVTLSIILNCGRSYRDINGRISS